MGPVSNPNHTAIASSSYAAPQTNDVDEDKVVLQHGIDDEKESGMNEGGGYVEEEEEIGAFPVSPAPEPEVKQYETVTQGGPVNEEYEYYDEEEVSTKI